MRIALLALALTGCAASAGTPERAVASYVRALRSHDAARAFALLSSAAQARTSPDALESDFLADEDAVAEAAHDLSEIAGRPRITAVVRDTDGAPFSLEMQSEQWRIADLAVITPWDRSTPEAALRSFLRAWDQRRADALLTLVVPGALPAQDVAGLQNAWFERNRDMMERVVARLRSVIDVPAEVRGTSASIHASNGATVRFSRIGRDWSVDLPNTP